MDRDDIIRMAREAGLAYGSDEKPLGSVTRFAALVSAKNKREWVGLTDEEINAFVWNMPYEPGQAEIRAIEARLKEKNNG